MVYHGLDYGYYCRLLNVKLSVSSGVSVLDSRTFSLTFKALNGVVLMLTEGYIKIL